MIDSKIQKINIEEIIKDPEMSVCVPDHLKTKTMCKHAVDHYKTQQMCYKVTKLLNGGMLTFVPDCYKDQNMYNKSVDNYPHALRSVPDCYKTQKVCD